MKESFSHGHPLFDALEYYKGTGGTAPKGHTARNLKTTVRQTRRRLGGRQPLCGVGVTSWIEPTSRPVA